MNRNLIIAIAAAVLVAAGGAYFLTSGTPQQTEVAATTEAGADSANVDTSGVVEMVLGDPEAAVEIIEYASFTCPHCRTFHETVFKDIKKDYIDTGKVRFVYREVYFDRFGLWAGMMARCAGPVRYFGIVDLIYENQNVWARASTPAETAEELKKIGRQAGMTDETLDACMQDPEQAELLLAWWEQNAASDGISSTPSFVINGKNYNNMNYAEFRRVLDAEIGG